MGFLRSYSKGHNELMYLKRRCKCELARRDCVRLQSTFGGQGSPLYPEPSTLYTSEPSARFRNVLASVGRWQQRPKEWRISAHNRFLLRILQGYSWGIAYDFCKECDHMQTTSSPLTLPKHSWAGFLKSEVARLEPLRVRILLFRFPSFGNPRSLTILNYILYYTA